MQPTASTRTRLRSASSTHSARRRLKGKNETRVSCDGALHLPRCVPRRLLTMNKIRLIALIVGWLSVAWGVSAQTASVTGAIHDETGGALPGVSIELRGGPGTPIVAVTDNQGTYRFDGLAAGRYEVSVTLPNFAAAHREVTISPTGTSRVDLVLHLALSADVTVTGKGTFMNLADAQNPAANLVGSARSASQGAITAKQLEARPTMRSGEVLETVPDKIAKNVKIGVDVFNLLNAADSDIDYYYASRLPGEPAGGVDDIHFHPTLPRTARVSLMLGF